MTDDELVIDDNPVPLGPGASATAAAGGVTAPQATPVPSPTAGPGPDDEIILDDEIPLGSVTDPGTTAAAVATLPQTGESSHAPYYITGLTLAALGLLLSRTRTGKRKR
ncbi:LPXTG cell wall anchor domain-containing protein [Paenibacillus typhae]|uniref:LPXTG cell wall anchor domain-containing protein n=1 Tax=Paenibacillus typhae TaxID=1174501 RepID=UPI001428C949|nr:LPXTG cell wall anchor domain-containing protein [Paenibacillus typhae]